MDLLTARAPADALSPAKARLQRMRSQLEAQRRSEAEELAKPPEERGEDTTPSQHPADVASDLEGHEFMLARELIDSKDLRDIDEALARIDDGTYGKCVDCGRPIPPERLEVLPQAARDVECERRWRRGDRLFSQQRSVGAIYP